MVHYEWKLIKTIAFKEDVNFVNFFFFLTTTGIFKR